MVCKNMTLRPKNKIARAVIGSIDKCPHLNDMKGVNFNFTNLSKIGKGNVCPVQKLCKYYEEAE